MPSGHASACQGHNIRLDHIKHTPDQGNISLVTQSSIPD
jgi:hypothetical protein